MNFASFLTYLELTSLDFNDTQISVCDVGTQGVERQVRQMKVYGGVDAVIIYSITGERIAMIHADLVFDNNQLFIANAKVSDLFNYVFR